MKLFNPHNATISRRHAKIAAQFEFAYTMVDFCAALLFIVGSVLFFRESTVQLGTWMFLIGSIFFGVKPSIRLWREFLLMRAGDYEEVSSQ